MKKGLFITLIVVAIVIAILSSVGSMTYGTDSGRGFFTLVGLLNLFVWAAAIVYSVIKRKENQLGLRRNDNSK